MKLMKMSALRKWFFTSRLAFVIGIFPVATTLLAITTSFDLGLYGGLLGGIMGAAYGLWYQKIALGYQHD